MYMHTYTHTYKEGGLYLGFVHTLRGGGHTAQVYVGIIVIHPHALRLLYIAKLDDDGWCIIQDARATEHDVRYINKTWCQH